MSINRNSVSKFSNFSNFTHNSAFILHVCAHKDYLTGEETISKCAVLQFALSKVTEFFK